MNSLSILILTHDNAGTLPDTLRSVAFADEVVVVDSGSTDGSQEIAHAAGARVLQRPLTNFADQRNAGWEAARGPWVLALDSDEVLDAEAREAVRRVIEWEPGPGEPAAYALCPIPYFLGRPILHGGVRETFVLRLAWRKRSRWAGRIHERLVVDGPTARLPGRIEHYSAPTLAVLLDKIRRNALGRAEEWRSQGARPSVRALVWRPLRFFLGRWIVRVAACTGWSGGGSSRPNSCSRTFSTCCPRTCSLARDPRRLRKRRARARIFKRMRPDRRSRRHGEDSEHGMWWRPPARHHRL